MATITNKELRSQFPSLDRGVAYFENAGGSQVPRQVIERVSDLFLHGYVQTGAGYRDADYVDDVTGKAKKFANVLMNGERMGETLVGPSTTALLHRLSDAMAPTVQQGDEIVVSVANHEANIGPWLKLERHGAKVVWWGVDPLTGAVSYEELGRLLTTRTKFVALAHTSNLLGDITDVALVAKMAHESGAQIVVDGVAFAPHQAVDVRSWDVDFYAFSFYKVYAPHIAALFGKSEAWAALKGPNHYFIPDDAFPWKFELGCQPYELLAGVLGLADYLSLLAGRPEHDRQTVETAFQVIRSTELKAQEAILEYLLARNDIRLVGPTDLSNRHPTFSFVHDQLPSNVIATRANQAGVGVRNGHMYAKRLCEALGVAPDPGFVRVSAVHYNDSDDVTALLTALDAALKV